MGAFDPVELGVPVSIVPDPFFINDVIDMPVLKMCRANIWHSALVHGAVFADAVVSLREDEVGKSVAKNVATLASNH